MNGYKKKTKADEIYELRIQLRDEQLQNTHLAQKCSDLSDENDMLKRVNESLEKSVKIWEISHSEQRKKIVKFLKHVESYPVQYTPGLRAEIENMINYFSK